MNLLAASSQPPLWVLLLGFAFIIFLKWLSIGCHKAAIRAEILKKQAKPLRIRWLPDPMGSRDSGSIYEAKLILPSGRRVTAECTYNFSSGIFWKDAPWAENKLRKTAAGDELPEVTSLPRIVADCPRCGYGLAKGAYACPNCGTDVAS